MQIKELDSNIQTSYIPVTNNFVLAKGKRLASGSTFGYR